MTLKDTYKKEIIARLKKELGISNSMAVPKLVKIVVNCGLGEALRDSKAIQSMKAQLAVITGQKPIETRAKRAISTFKLRAGDVIGLKITLRGTRMYIFLQKFATLALPRVHDFRGVSVSGFDGRGNYTMGITDQTIFPELEYSLVDKARGFEITFVTTAKNTEHGKKLLEMLGIPFEKEEKH